MQKCNLPNVAILNLNVMVVPCKGATEMLDIKEEKKRGRDWCQDLLSFRSLNQESIDAIQTARSSSLVDGRLAHIVLKNDKRSSIRRDQTLDN